METTGLFVGKFLPPHLGHLDAIKKAKQNCTHLIIIVCFEPLRTQRLCDEMGVEFISLEQRAKWIKDAINDPEVEFLTLDETGITSWPEGWEEWSKRVKKVLGNRKIDCIFGNERKYVEGYKKWFKESEYIMLDPDRKTVKISASQIRKNLKKYFDYLIEPAQPFFKKYIK